MPLEVVKNLERLANLQVGEASCFPGALLDRVSKTGQLIGAGCPVGADVHRALELALVFEECTYLGFEIPGHVFDVVRFVGFP